MIRTASIMLALCVSSSFTYNDDAGGYSGKGDLEACRPHGNEISVVRIEDGRIDCVKHEYLAYGQADKLPVELQSPVNGY